MGYKGAQGLGKSSIIVGNVRDVEIMIGGARSAVPYYDVILRTGAWGKDIVVPTAIAAAAPLLQLKPIGHIHLRSSGNLLVQQYLRLEKGRQRFLALLQ